MSGLSLKFRMDSFTCSPNSACYTSFQSSLNYQGYFYIVFFDCSKHWGLFKVKHSTMTTFCVPFGRQSFILCRYPNKDLHCCLKGYTSQMLFMLMSFKRSFANLYVSPLTARACILACQIQCNERLYQWKHWPISRMQRTVFQM